MEVFQGYLMEIFVTVFCGFIFYKLQENKKKESARVEQIESVRDEVRFNHEEIIVLKSERQFTNREVKDIKNDTREIKSLIHDLMQNKKDV